MNIRMRSSWLVSLALILGLPCNAPAQGVQWEQRNGQWIGDVRAFAIAGDGTLLVGAEGVHRTSDLGATWVKATGDLVTYPIVSLLTVSNSLVLAGSSYYGIFMSTDFGASWGTSSNGLGNSAVRSLAKGLAPRVFAATDGGLYVSPDSAKSWSLDPSIGSQRMISVLVSPGQIVYAASYASGIYYSTDQGSTWQNISNNLTKQSLRTFTVVGDTVILVDGYDGTVGSYGAWVTSTLKKRGSWIRTGYTISEPESYLGYRPYTLVTDPSGNVIAGKSGSILVSTDFGESWSLRGTIASGVLTLFRSPDAAWFAGSANSAWVSHDTLANWSQFSHGLPTSGFGRQLTADKSSNIYLGLDAGVYRTTDNGLSWNQSAIAPGNPPIYALSASPTGTIFASSPGKGLFRSTNAGQTWARVQQGLVDSTFISFAYSTTGTVFAGSTNGGIFRSTDDGLAWTLANMLTPSSDVSTLAVTSGEVVLAINSLRTLIRSTDGGITWSNDKPYLFSLGPNSWQSPALLAGPGGHVYAQVGGFMLRSPDNGATWDTILTGLRGWTVTNFVINTIGELYASAGVAFRFRESDERWYDLGTTAGGLLAVDSAGFLWTTSSWDPSLSRSVSPSTGIGADLAARVPTEFRLEQNYPNPFNPKTVVSYQLSVASNVMLVVYDVLGREVALLVNEKRAPGVYTVQFDGSSMASGVYWYRLTAGGISETRKMILVK